MSTQARLLQTFYQSNNATKQQTNKHITTNI